ncbi:MAG TPA: hypothetical protein VK501_08695, partial [Baekduia sp.]
MSVTTTPAPGRGVADDYEPFCVLFRRLCGIDLLQYKRGQMERRIRSFVSTRGGDADLLTYCAKLTTDKAELDR